MLEELNVLHQKRYIDVMKYHSNTNNLQIPPLRAYINMLNLDTEKSNMLWTQTTSLQSPLFMLK